MLSYRLHSAGHTAIRVSALLPRPHTNDTHTHLQIHTHTHKKNPHVHSHIQIRTCTHTQSQSHICSQLQDSCHKYCGIDKREDVALEASHPASFVLLTFTNLHSRPNSIPPCAAAETLLKRSSSSRGRKRKRRIREKPRTFLFYLRGTQSSLITHEQTGICSKGRRVLFALKAVHVFDIYLLCYI